MHRARVLILSCQLGIRRGGYKNCQEYQAIRPKKVVLGNLQSEFNFYVKNHQLRKKKLANRLGGGIKRRFHVPKLSEGCSFFNPQKNQQKRLECWKFIIFEVQKCVTVVNFKNGLIKMSNSPTILAHFRLLGAPGGALAALGRLCGSLCVRLCVLGAAGGRQRGSQRAPGDFFWWSPCNARYFHAIQVTRIKM